MNKMSKFEGYSRFLTWFMALLLSALAAGCGSGHDGGRDAILGTPGIGTVVPPTVPVPPAPVSVASTNPIAAAAGVCPNATINATFTTSGSRMDPLTVNTTTFTVTGPGVTPVVAAAAPNGVVLDAATGRIATFTPLNPLANGVLYTATIRGGAAGVKDLAIPANAMLADFTWTFTAGPATGICIAPIALNSASTFGGFGGAAGMTNSGLLTVINGDIGTTGASTLMTGFHDAGPGCTYTETPLNVGTVTGKIFTAPPPPTGVCSSEGTAATSAIATQALADAQTAFNTLAALPNGIDVGTSGAAGPGELGGRTLAPGIYKSAPGTYGITLGDLTLDAQNNANAVWVFQMATSLTVGIAGPTGARNIILINGAQAKNVFWQVGSAATINAAGGGTMAGTIISSAGTTFSTAGNVAITTLNGRALALNASVTMVDTHINVPAP